MSIGLSRSVTGYGSIAKGFFQVGVQRLCLVGFVRNRIQTFCHASGNQRDRFAAVEMFVIQGVGSSFIPCPTEVGVARGVDGSSIASQHLLLVNTDVMLEIC